MRGWIPVWSAASRRPDSGAPDGSPDDGIGDCDAALSVVWCALTGGRIAKRRDTARLTRALNTFTWSRHAYSILLFFPRAIHSCGRSGRVGLVRMLQVGLREGRC